ncbi:MAG: hypothetical protein ILNGONEN_01227 [Syntrophorhabdaceae bacterium]|nr:hypothetical protein [Syntrophorhabdaceae bacterium]
MLLEPGQQRVGLSRPEALQGIWKSLVAHSTPIPNINDVGGPGIEGLNTVPGRLTGFVEQVNAISMTGTADTNNLFSFNPCFSHYFADRFGGFLPQRFHAALRPAGFRIVGVNLAAGDL